MPKKHEGNSLENARIDIEGSPWDRQACDTPKSYKAFKAFLMLGPERSLPKAYEVETGKKVAHAPSHWKDWSAEHGWQYRAAMYDAQRDQKLLERHSDNIAEAEEFLSDNLLPLVERACTIAMGHEKASMVSWLALQQACRWAGLGMAKKEEAGEAKEQVGSITLIMPDNGRRSA